MGNAAAAAAAAVPLSPSIAASMFCQVHGLSLRGYLFKVDRTAFSYGKPAVPKHAHSDAERMVADTRRMSWGMEMDRGKSTALTVGSDVDDGLLELAPSLLSSLLMPMPSVLRVSLESQVLPSRRGRFLLPMAGGFEAPPRCMARVVADELLSRLLVREQRDETDTCNSDPCGIECTTASAAVPPGRQCSK